MGTILILGSLCSHYFSGCRSVQRDYLQAPPPIEAASTTAIAEADHTWAIVESALKSVEGYRTVPILRCPTARFYRVGKEVNIDGRLLIATPDPVRPAEIAIEARFGRFGNPAAEREYVAALAGRINSMTAGNRDDADRIEERVNSGLQIRSTTELSGRWIDLDAAVNGARQSKSAVEGAVISTDRWRYAIVYELRTLDDQPATLVVVGDFEGKAGPRQAMMRIGHFGDREPEENAFLRRLRTELTKLESTPRWDRSR